MPSPAKPEEKKQPTPAAPNGERGFDFGAGVPLAALAENVPHRGFVGADDVVGVRQGAQVFVVSHKCSHYGAPMHLGRVDGERLMCPWHHACFSIKDGAALKAPALAPLKSYVTTVADGRATAQPKGSTRRRAGVVDVEGPPQSVTLVGAGPAAFSAVAELRQQGYDGPIHVFGGEKEAPYDRTKLSKGFLAAQLKAEELALDGSFFAPAALGGKAAPVNWHLGVRVEKLAVATKTLQLADGTRHPYDALILATGAAPSPPGIAGEQLGHVHVLRSVADAGAFRAAAEAAKQVLIVGASFIGMEVACALRQRGMQVHVVAQDDAPMQKVLGRSVGQTLMHLHKEKGVTFTVGRKVAAIEKGRVRFDDGSHRAAAVVLLAVGVKPLAQLAQAAGLRCDDGILVDAQLRTSAPHVWAVGDVARYPSPQDGRPLRIEHWSVAEQMGRVAARNVLGQHVAFVDVPFFWTEHFGLKVRYVGHTRRLQHDEYFGDVEKGRAAVALFEGEQVGAVLSVGCDDVSMACEAALAAGRPGEVLPLLRKL